MRRAAACRSLCVPVMVGVRAVPVVFVASMEVGMDRSMSGALGGDGGFHGLEQPEPQQNGMAAGSDGPAGEELPPDLAITGMTLCGLLMAVAMAPVFVCDRLINGPLSEEDEP